MRRYGGMERQAYDGCAGAAPCILVPIPAHPGAFVAHFQLPATYIYPRVCGSFLSITHVHASSQYICTMGTHVLY